MRNRETPNEDRLIPEQKVGMGGSDLLCPDRSVEETTGHIKELTFIARKALADLEATRIPSSQARFSLVDI